MRRRRLNRAEQRRRFLAAETQTAVGQTLDLARALMADGLQRAADDLEAVRNVRAVEVAGIAHFGAVRGCRIDVQGGRVGAAAALKLRAADRGDRVSRGQNAGRILSRARHLGRNEEEAGEKDGGDGAADTKEQVFHGCLPWSLVEVRVAYHLYTTKVNTMQVLVCQILQKTLHLKDIYVLFSQNIYYKTKNAHRIAGANDSR